MSAIKHTLAFAAKLAERGVLPGKELNPNKSQFKYFFNKNNSLLNYSYIKTRNDVLYVKIYEIW